MSSVVISGDTSGAITLAAPAVSGTNTATLPAATGTVMVSGNMPAFSAYSDATTQTFTVGTYTKVLFQVKEFDTNNNFASSLFTPTVGGYYQVSSSILFPAATPTVAFVAIYKNGSDFKEGCRIYFPSGSGGPCVSALIYLNGSTDYVEIYGLQSSSTSQALAGGNNQFLNYFQASLVRAA